MIEPRGDQGDQQTQETQRSQSHERTGQLAADATEDDKRRAALVMIDEQIDQMQTQLQRFEDQRNRESRQRLIGGTASAVVLAVAFALLALAAVL